MPRKRRNKRYNPYKHDPYVRHTDVTNCHRQKRHVKKYGAGYALGGLLLLSAILRDHPGLGYFGFEALRSPPRIAQTTTEVSLEYSEFNNFGVPPVISRTNQPTAQISLENSAPYPLVITLINERDRYELNIPPCKECTVHHTPPRQGCAQDQRYTRFLALSPGLYKVESRWKAANVRIGKGDWTLQGNSLYGQCLYVITHKVPDDYR